MLKEKLSKIGLTDGEAEVYELLIERGESKAGELIKSASLASSKVYEVLQRLVNKGLASFSVKDGIKRYQATPPERLVDFLEDKKSQIDQAKEEVLKIIPAIKQKNESRQSTNNIRMYIGRDGPKIAIKELAEASMKDKCNYGYGTQDNPFAERYPKELKEWFETEKRYGLKTKIIFAEGHKQRQPSAQIRYLPPGFLSPVRTMIAGHKVFLVDFTEPFTTIIIENKAIAQSYKDHFLMLWKTAKA
ncbi:MAG: helix-turn-helix domain-containing protein [Nanoarchaeota archaeon]